ncbi:MAG TPA: DUF6766 family protein [Candidatus Limnocylindrales bacterium]|nr:DUF6766 family protein [Candidatus Limnocylindrales bacterium]
MRKLLRENSLSLAMFVLFVVSLAGQIWAGLAERNAEAESHGQPAQSLPAYLSSGHFIEAVFENWESEFLQMGAFVVLTVVLRQKGSSESKSVDGDEEVDREPEAKPGAPWAVWRGGLVQKLYENSLAIALFALFGLSFVLHAVGGSMDYNDEQAAQGDPERVTPVSYVATSRFWFESFQNWQSEFMSVGALVVLSIFLRQKGSPESKPVDAPHGDTGG